MKKLYIEVTEVPNPLPPSRALCPVNGLFYHRVSGILYQVTDTSVLQFFIGQDLPDVAPAGIDPYKLLAVALHPTVAEKVL